MIGPLPAQSENLVRDLDQRRSELSTCEHIDRSGEVGADMGSKLFVHAHRGHQAFQIRQSAKRK
jgi:hypothetical protein